MEIKLARIKKGLTQVQLCKIVKISPNKLVEIEKGNYDKVAIGLAKKIAILLEIPIQAFFFQK